MKLSSEIKLVIMVPYKSLAIFFYVLLFEGVLKTQISVT